MHADAGQNVPSGGLWRGGHCKGVCMQKPAKMYPVVDCGVVDTLMGCACVAAEVGERVHGDGL